MRRVIFISQLGCLLPFLIIFNLFFGWIFFKISTWLLVEAGLVVLFIILAVFTARVTFSKGSLKRGHAIDVEAKVVGEEPDKKDSRDLTRYR